MSDQVNGRREAIYDFIVQFKAAHDGISPTIREIMAACDITSTSVTSHHLMMLERAGRIVRYKGDRGATRNIMLAG